MRAYYSQIKLLIARIAFVYFFYFLCRLIFFLYNKNSFSDVGFIEFFKLCFYALRFDSFSIVVSNSLFILLSLLPHIFYHNKIYQSILKLVFVLCNTIFIIFNLIDVVYFRFLNKRSSWDLINQMGGQSDLLKLLPDFINDFWWLFLLLALGIFFFFKFFEFSKSKFNLTVSTKFLLKEKTMAYSILVFIILLCVLAVRGGLQRVPIDIVNAAKVAGSKNTAIVLNTPFTIIKSQNQSQLPEYNFYSSQEISKIYSPYHHFKDSTFKRKNVVVLILEGFSKDFTKLGSGKSLTPFLDSLMQHSLVFKNGFSNGTRSIEGIPCILSSLPSYMENPFINSVYANNKQVSLASVLNKEGYYSAFFHGGINGTMNFTDWAASAEYQDYFGKNEYNNDVDFDGDWGIYDEPFLQFFANKMNGFKQPFHTALFTLSSHHPYKIPEKYKGKFPKTEHPNSEAIGYSDYSLKQFLISASKTGWYKNTLFVLCADHASISDQSLLKNFSIPILFFSPDNALRGEFNDVFSQADVLPTTLKILGYNKPFFSFGNDMNSKQKHLSLYYTNGSYYMFQDSMQYLFVDNKLIEANYFIDNGLNSGNVISKNKLRDSIGTQSFKAFVQTYNSTLIHNSIK